MAVDPVLGIPEIPASWNRYTYVKNNPLRLVDPNGMDDYDVYVWVSPSVDHQAAYDYIWHSLRNAQRYLFTPGGHTVHLAEFGTADFVPASIDFPGMKAIAVSYGQGFSDHDLLVLVVPEVYKEGSRVAGITHRPGWVIAVSPDGTTTMLTAHEFGHNFGLIDVDDSTNMMNEVDLGGRTLTEEQLVEVRNGLGCGDSGGRCRPPRSSPPSPNGGSGDPGFGELTWARDWGFCFTGISCPDEDGTGE